MKKFILLSVFVSFWSASFCQLSKEFEKLDSLNSYKNVEFGSSISEASKKMGLILIKESDGFRYSISNKKYLTIGKFTFPSGEAGFLFKKLKIIHFETNHFDSKYFQELLDYFTSQFGSPESKKECCYYWTGENIAYNLIRNTKNNHIILGITSLQE